MTHRLPGQPFKNPRWERFAWLLAAAQTGIDELTPHKAYPLAGYKPNRGNPYRLKEDERMQERVQEIIDEAFSKEELDAAITPEWIRTKITELARGAEQESVKLKALETLARYQEGMTEQAQKYSVTEEARKLIESVGYGIAKAMLEERGLAYVLDSDDLRDITPANGIKQRLLSDNVVTDAQSNNINDLDDGEHDKQATQAHVTSEVTSTKPLVLFDKE